jgi:hypothetical protein
MLLLSMVFSAPEHFWILVCTSAAAVLTATAMVVWATTRNGMKRLSK